MTGRRVIITGGSGFIGTNLVKLLVAQGREVLSIDPHPPKISAQRAFWCEMDIRDAATLRRQFADFSPTECIHLGARTDLEETKALSGYSANIEGTAAVVEAVRAQPELTRLIVASSRLVCRIGYQPKSDTDYQPSTVYGQSKIETERIVRAAGLRVPWCLMRITSIWGPYFEVPYKLFFMQVARGRYVHPAGRRILKSFGYVENTAHQISSLLDCDPALFSGRTFYVGDDPPLDIQQWARLIRQTLGLKEVPTVPLALLRLPAWTGDALQAFGMKNVPLTTFRLNNLLTPMVHDLALIHQIAGPARVDVATGVQRTVDWLRAAGQLQATR